MKELDIETAKLIIEKYDEILHLCGAPDGESIMGAIEKFKSSLEPIIASSEQMKERGDNEIKQVTDMVASKMWNDVVMLIGMSISQTLQAAGQTYAKMADDKDTLKKAADEWMTKNISKE